MIKVQDLFASVESNVSADLMNKAQQEMERRNLFFQMADAPFRYKDYECTYDGSTYVSGQVMVDRANLLLDNWSQHVGNYELDKECWTVGIMVTVQAVINGEEKSVTQRGVNRVTLRKEENSPSGDAIERSIKAAITDGLKKCFSWLGIASHVYRGELDSISKDKNDGSPNPIFKKLCEVYGLSEWDYRNGIPILPDDFRTYYQKMGWTDGIFKSDLDSVWSDKGGGGHTDGRKQTSNGNSNQEKGNSRKQQVKSISEAQAKLILNLADEAGVSGLITLVEEINYISPNALEVPTAIPAEYKDKPRDFAIKVISATPKKDGQKVINHFKSLPAKNKTA